MIINISFRSFSKCLLLSALFLSSSNALATVKTNHKLSVHNVTVNESAGVARVEVSLSKKSTKIVKVKYATKPRSGIPGKDYKGVSGLLSFKPGQVTKIIAVKVLDDKISEPNEFFKVKIYSAKNANIAKGSATVTIRDNERKKKPASKASTSITTTPVTTPQTKPLPKAQPIITLLSPNDNASYAENSLIQIRANAADSDGNISQVAFYDNGNLLGVDKNKPYNFQLNNASIGSHDITAITTDNDGITSESNTHRINIQEDTLPAGPNSLVVYPANNEIQKNFESNRFSVTVSQNGINKNAFVYESGNSSHPGWSGTLDYMQKANHWTTFSFNGSVDVKAKRLDGKTVKSCVIRPLALNIKPIIEGDTCSFKLTQHAKVSVEIDETKTLSKNFSKTGPMTKHIIQHPLFVFADPLEIDKPKPSDKNVLYFAPGIHRIGKEYQLKNNTQVYIAGGAYVIGTFKTAETNPKNITIRGRGILSGIDLTETKKEHNQWGNHSIDFSRGRSGSNLLIEGITITDPLRSCIISYNTVDIRNVKLFSWSHRNDGITAGKNSTIEDNFIKVQDDNIKIYYSNQTIRRNVIWQQTAGAVFKFAWNLAGVSQDNKISDIDVIHSDVFDDYSGAEKDRPDMRSTSAIFSAMAFRKNAAFKNASFKNIRIEEKHLYRLMGLRMVTTHQHANDPSKNVYWGDPSPNSSKTIEGLTFENVKLAGMPYKQSTLYGNKGGKIRNIHFKGLKVAGKTIGSKGLLSSRNDGTGLLTAGDVTNITFSP